MTSKANLFNPTERQHLLQGESKQYGGAVGTLSSSMNVDPEIVKRALEMVAEQKLRESRPSDSAILSAKVSTKNEIPFDDKGNYVGDIVDGEPHGRGVLTYHPGHNRKKYDGQWQEGQFHGRGVLIFSNGDRYEGQWQFGQLHGEGRKILANGHREEGHFLAGKLHGKGRVNWPDGASYDGMWAANQKHGQGVYIDENGKKYTGGWYKNERCGQGTQTDRNRIVYKGEWAHDQYDGEGVRYDSHGISKGTFRDGALWNGEFSVRAHNYARSAGVDKEPSCCSFCPL